jgi:hypothetical protein
MRAHAANPLRITNASSRHPSALDSKVLALHWRQCKTKNCSLELPEDMTEVDWVGVGNTLGILESNVSWWIGDWWAYGETKYGQRKAIVEAEGWQGPAFQTCMNAAGVAKRFTTSRRREVLSFTHHAAVAAMHPDDADSLLDWAQEAIAENGRPRSVRQMQEERWTRYHNTRLPAPGTFSARITSENLAPTRAVARIIQVPAETLPAGIEKPESTRRAPVHWLGDDKATEMVMNVVRRIALTMTISERLRARLALIQGFLESGEG